jgi:Secretion system C-terminal sorting domain
MKMRFTFAVTLLCPVLLAAQPTITSDWIGKAGEEVSSVFTLEVPDIGDAGADKSWDFSNVTPDTIALDFKFVNPDTTPFFASYPNSNSCLAVPELGIYSYFKLDDSAWEFYGNVFGITQLILQNPQTQLMFPMTFEDSFSDDYESTREIIGIFTFGTGNVKVTADAYGTVTLPTGTFDNVMRIKTIDESVDSTDLGSGIFEKVHTTSTTYIWYSADHPGPLCIRDYSESFQVALVPPIPPDTVFMDPDSSFQYDPTAGLSAVPYFTTDAFELEVVPNPFVSVLNLNFTVDNGQELKIELQTINGQVVYSQDYNATQGYNNLEINVQGLPAGSYIALLRGENEGSIKRLIKIE